MLASLRTLLGKPVKTRHLSDADRAILAARNKLDHLRKTRTTRHVTTQMVSRFFETTQTSLDIDAGQAAQETFDNKARN